LLNRRSLFHVERIATRASRGISTAALIKAAVGEDGLKQRLPASLGKDRPACLAWTSHSRSTRALAGAAASIYLGIEMTRWKLFGVSAVTVSLIAAIAYALAPDPVQSLQFAVRATARTSFILFLAAFTASSLAKLWPARLTKALMRERRYIGLSFAFSMLLHAIALIVYIKTAPAAFWIGRTAATNVPGSIGYLMILLLTITSFKTFARLIGPANWKRLHRAGVWFVATTFAASFFTRAHLHPSYVVPGMIMIVAMLLRVVARFANVQRANALLK
jgi:methionine sulfoxide reductase heme-binding subunit